MKKVVPYTHRPKMLLDLSKSEDAHLRVASEHVALLNSLPGFRDLPTEQLRRRIPPRYHKFVPPVSDGLNYTKDDLMARAVIIGMLALPSEIESFIGIQFLERLQVP